MMRIGKAYNLKIISLAISAALLFSSTVYSYSLSRMQMLRVPSSFQNGKHRRRTRQAIIKQALKRQVLRLKSKPTENIIPEGYPWLQEARIRLLQDLGTETEEVLTELARGTTWTSESTPIDMLGVPITCPIDDWEVMDLMRTLFLRIDAGRGFKIKGTGRTKGTFDKKFTNEDISDPVLFNETSRISYYIWYGMSRFRAQAELAQLLGLQSLSYAARGRKSKAIATPLEIIEVSEVMVDGKVIPLKEFILQMEERVRAVLSADGEDRNVELHGLGEREWFRELLIGHIAVTKLWKEDKTTEETLEVLRDMTDEKLVDEYIREVGVVQLLGEAPTYLRASHFKKDQLRERLEEEVNYKGQHSYNIFLEEKKILDDLLSEIYSVFGEEYKIPEVSKKDYKTHITFKLIDYSNRERIDIYSYLTTAYLENKGTAERILEEISRRQAEGFCLMYGSGSYMEESFESRNQIAGCVLTDSDLDQGVIGTPYYKWDQKRYEDNLVKSLKIEPKIRKTMHGFITGDENIKDKSLSNKTESIFWNNMRKWYHDIQNNVIDNPKTSLPETHLDGFKEWRKNVTRQKIKRDARIEPFLRIVSDYENKKQSISMDFDTNERVPASKISIPSSVVLTGT